MAVRTLLWRGLDAPRMEIVRVESLDRANGTQIGIAYELRWRLDGACWSSPRTAVPESGLS